MSAVPNKQPFDAGRAAYLTLNFMLLFFLLAPIVIVLIFALNPTPYISFPPVGVSLRWFEKFFGSSEFMNALWLSLWVAGCVLVFSILIGGASALALARGNLPGRGFLTAFFMSPLMLPGLVIGIAMLQGFKSMGLRDVYISLMVAHVVITLPYVVRTVVGALSLFDFSLIDAARTLGCNYPMALTRVLVPALAPAFLTSGMFAFLASMDNYPISIFFTDAWTKTLPIQMLQYVEENPDPTIAAISSGLVLLVVLALVVGGRLVGLRKLADF